MEFVWSGFCPSSSDHIFGRIHKVGFVQLFKFEWRGCLSGYMDFILHSLVKIEEIIQCLVIVHALVSVEVCVV